MSRQNLYLRDIFFIILNQVLYVAIVVEVPVKTKENAKNLSMDASNVTAREDSLESYVKSAPTDAKMSSVKTMENAKLLARPSNVNAREDSLESTVKIDPIKQFLKWNYELSVMISESGPQFYLILFVFI